MGRLTLAKTIADNPDIYNCNQLQDARDYLEGTRRNGGVRNSERALARLQRRLDRLTSAIDRRFAGDYRREEDIDTNEPGDLSPDDKRLEEDGR